MSRGLVNIVLYDIDQTEDTLTRFVQQRSGYLDAYPLSDEERAAFETWNYGALYAMGAHPFLLWQTVRSLAILDGVSIQDTVAEYRSQVTPHGYPDFIT